MNSIHNYDTLTIQQSNNPNLFDNLLNATNSADIYSYEQIALTIENILNESIDFNKYLINGYLIIKNKKIKFNNFRKLSKIVRKIKEENKSIKFQIFITDTNIKIYNWIFNTKIDNSIIKVNYNELKLGVLFDSNFWLYKKNSKPHQELYAAFQHNKQNISILKEISLALIHMEKRGKYNAQEEKILLQNFYEKITKINVNYKKVLNGISRFSIDYFFGIYEFFKEIKNKFKGDKFENIINNFDEIKNPFLPKEIIQDDIRFYTKFYNAINIEEYSESKEKKPLLGDRMIANTAILNNIFSFPSKTILVSDDEDINSISNFLINCIIPHYLILVIIVNYTYTKGQSDEQNLMNLKVNLAQEGNNYDNFIEVINEEIEKLCKHMNSQSSTKKKFQQVLSIYKPQTGKIINHSINQLLFDALRGNNDSLEFLINSVCTSARLNNKLSAPYLHHGRVELVNSESRNHRIIRQSKDELIKTINEITLKKCKNCILKKNCKKICIL